MTTAWSLVPPLVALGLAVGTRRVVPSLAAGGLAGTLLLALLEGRPWLEGVLDFVRVGLLGRVSEPANAQMLVLITLIGGFVHLLEASGAGRSLVDWLTRGVRTPRQAELATWVGGGVLFFSDMGNVLILGPMFRPLYDRLGIPRERLAWIIDTTAAPICVLVPVIAWGVYAAGLIEAAHAGLQPPVQVDGFALLLSAFPFQAYPLLSLLFVPALVTVGRPWGPMARCEPTAPEAAADADAGPGAAAALVPVAVLFGVLVLAGGFLVSSEGKVTGAIVRTSLAAAYLAAIGSLLAVLARTGHAKGAGRTLQEGMGRAVPILVLLVLAWTLGEVCARLGTGAFLAGVLGSGLPAGLVPAAIFGIGAIMSFATGTSWGTFAILMPIGISLATALDAPIAVTIGAVLSGGIFGDHCSPISDTTLLASMAADTDHSRHVATQLPYALTVGAAALVALGVAGFTGSAWSVGAGAVVVVGAVLLTRRGSAGT